jgi:dihydroneopterin aldolase
VEGRLPGTLALVALAVAYGADIVRVHDVAEAADAARVAQACGGPSGPAPTGRISVLGLRFEATHGVLEAEHRLPQPFLVDLDLHLDLRAAARSDRLQDTIDYARAAQVVAAVVTGPHPDLLEHLAGEIAAALVTTFPSLTGGVVTLHKPQAPVGLPFADVMVRLPFGARGEPLPE